MKSSILIPSILLAVIAFSVSLLVVSFYIPETSKIAGFSAYEKIENIKDVQKIPGYEHAQIPSYVPEGFDIGPLIYRGLGDEHHAIHLFYGSKGDSFEEIRDFGFQITFHDTPEPSWEKTAKAESNSFNTINNKTVVYYQYDSLETSSVVYGGDPLSVTIRSNSLDLGEQEKILRSIIDDKSYTKWQLEGDTIPIKLDNVVLEYIRAEYHNQKIYMHVTMIDDNYYGMIEFTFPKQTALEIFDKESCSIFDRFFDTSKFNLRVNQELRGQFDISDPDKLEYVNMSLLIPRDSSIVELFSTCNTKPPFLDRVLTISDTGDSLKYAASDQTEIIDGTINEESNMLFLTMTPSSSLGYLTIELPRSVIDAKHDYCTPRLETPVDDNFAVLENGYEINFEEIFTTPEKRILKIPFDENTSEIEIIDTCF